MNTDLFNSLAQRLTHEPHLLAEAEDQTLRELLLRRSTGLLDTDTAKEADALIASDSRAAAIWAEYQATDEHLKTEAGKEWLSSARDRMLLHLSQSEAAPANVIRPDFSSPASESAKSPRQSWLERTKATLGVGDKTSRHRLVAETPVEPIKGSVGEAIVYSIGEGEDGKASLWIKSSSPDWTKLHVELDVDWKSDVDLPQVGRVWVITLPLPRELSSYQGTQPRITLRS